MWGGIKMIPPHFFYQIYILFLEQNDCTPPKCGKLSENNQDVWMGQMCTTDAGTTQDNFILPAPPVGGLPISQDWLDRMKLVRDHTIPIILPSGNNILANSMFKIIIGYTNLGTRQIHCSVCLFFIAPNANMAGYPTENNVVFGKILKDTLLYHHPIQVSL